MDTLLQDVRAALRALAARPTFAAVAVLTLALGVGATSALFSVVHGVLLQPLPYPDSSRIVALWQTARDNPQPSVGGTVPHPNFLDWKRDARSFEAMALYSSTNFNVTGLGEAEIVPGGVVTPGFFKAFASAPVLGREFTAEEDRPTGPRAIIVSYGFWQERLGGRADVVGTTLDVSGRTWNIVGVAPAGFSYPGKARLWQPVRNDDTQCGRGCVYLDGIARLAPGVTVDAARREMTAIAERLEREYPQSNTNVTAGISSLQEQIVGDVKAPLLMLLGAVTMLLLIACANVANLLLVRGAARQADIAVRSALGAGRARLLRFLLTESAVLGIAGAAAGLLVAGWAVDILKQLAPPSVPRLDEVGVNAMTFAFALAMALVTALLFGLAPALQIIRTPLVSLIGGRGELGARRSRWSRSGLLAAEVALSLMLLAGAGLLVRSMYELESVAPGWRSEGVSVFLIGLPPSRYPARADVVGTFDQIDERLAALPGVQAVGRITGLPLGPSENVQTFRRPDRPAPAPGQVPNALYNVIDQEYFKAAEIPLLSGRGFDSRDGAGGQPSIIISREMADQFWPGEDAVGKQMDLDGTRRTIVGVAAGVRSRTLEAPPQPEMYVPHAQVDQRSMYFVIRSSQPPASVLRAAREVIRSTDSRVAVFRPSALTAVENAALARPRFYLMLLGLFAVLAVALAAVGIYGVVAYAVTQRTREIGLRMALGARSSVVLRLVVWQGMQPAIAGAILGLAGAFASGRVLAGLLYQIKPRDPMTLIGVVLLVFAIVLVACAIPAWRATRIAPSTALRAE
jgi:predicted permease